MNYRIPLYTALIVMISLSVLPNGISCPMGEAVYDDDYQFIPSKEAIQNAAESG